MAVRVPPCLRVDSCEASSGAGILQSWGPGRHPASCTVAKLAGARVCVRSNAKASQKLCEPSEAILTSPLRPADASLPKLASTRLLRSPKVAVLASAKRLRVHSPLRSKRSNPQLLAYAGKLGAVQSLASFASKCPPSTSSFALPLVVLASLGEAKYTRFAGLASRHLASF